MTHCDSACASRPENSIVSITALWCHDEGIFDIGPTDTANMAQSPTASNRNPDETCMLPTAGQCWCIHSMRPLCILPRLEETDVSLRYPDAAQQFVAALIELYLRGFGKGVTYMFTYTRTAPCCKFYHTPVCAIAIPTQVYKHLCVHEVPFTLSCDE